MSRFEGKVALITGGASGIGLATAERLAGLGARVVVADIDRTNGEAAAAKVGGRFAQLDVADAPAWPRVVEEIVATHGGLDLAFLNAGVTTYPAQSSGDTAQILLQPFDIATLPDASYRRILGANVDGVVFGTRAVVPALARRGGGAIVATASVAGLIAFAADPIYTLTKHAVVGLVRGLAPSLLLQGIRVNAICPGIVDTPLLGPDGRRVLSELGVPIMPASQIADAVAHAVESGVTGECFVCVAGREPTRHVFNGVEGVGLG